LPGIPETAETIAISRDLLLVEQTGIRAHFGQLSCARSVELIEQAQARGLQVTADIAAHQLFFNDEVLDGFNSLYHVNPPFRSENDRRALLGGVKRGVIGVICSDHQPHEAEAKSAPFAETAAGISSIEMLLPLTYRLVKKGFLTEAEWLKTLTSGPAGVLGIDAGNLAIGAPANLTIFDPQQSWVLNEDSLISMGSNTPFLGESFAGKVRMTFCSGHVTYQDL
jgi:dihydroorotase